MSNHFEEPSFLRRSNSDLLIQPDQSDFHRNSPHIESTRDAARLSDAPGPVDNRALAQKLIADQDLRARPDTGWKLFSPSTWKGLRDTAWGRKKAAKRQDRELTKRMTKLSKATKKLDPTSGFFSNAKWGTTTGRGITGAEAGSDPNLTTSQAYGMPQRTADAWGTATGALEAGEAFDQGSPEWKAEQKRYQDAVAGSGMDGREFRNLMGMGDTRPQQAVPMDDADHEVGDRVDGHGILDSPGDDVQDEEGDGIPNIVREVLGPKAGGLESHPRPRETVDDDALVDEDKVGHVDDQDSLMDDDDSDYDGEYQGKNQGKNQGKGPMWQRQMFQRAGIKGFD